MAYPWRGVSFGLIPPPHTFYSSILNQWLSFATKTRSELPIFHLPTPLPPAHRPLLRFSAHTAACNLHASCRIASWRPKLLICLRYWHNFALNFTESNHEMKRWSSSYKWMFWKSCFIRKSLGSFRIQSLFSHDRTPWKASVSHVQYGGHVGPAQMEGPRHTLSHREAKMGIGFHHQYYIYHFVLGDPETERTYEVGTEKRPDPIFELSFPVSEGG